MVLDIELRQYDMCLLRGKLQLDRIARSSGPAYGIANSDHIREETHEVVSMDTGAVTVHISDQNDFLVMRLG